jgi:prophage antirepressor-like protein
MENNLQIFNYNTNQIRTIQKDGEPWFVATDVCQTLDIRNATQTVCRLEKDERSMFNIGRQGEVHIVNEYGLYNLILGSRKEEAKQFKRWITHEVLPSIRKTGTYSTVDYSNLSPELQLFKTMFDSVANQQLRLQQTEQSLASIKETIVAIPDDWRASINRNLNAISRAVGPNEFKSVRSESYRLLENRGGCDLERRLMFLKARLETQGRSATEVKQANKLDVIEADKKLREIYQMIVKELTIKFVI